MPSKHLRRLHQVEVLQLQWGSNLEFREWLDTKGLTYWYNYEDGPVYVQTAAGEVNVWPTSWGVWDGTTFAAVEDWNFGQLYASYAEYTPEPAPDPDPEPEPEPDPADPA